MSEAHSFFANFKKNMLGTLYTSTIARVEAYDARQNKADITLLPGGDLVKSVPVAIQQTEEFYFRIPYKTGDLVLVCFSHRDIDPVLYDNGKIPSERMLAMDDAIIVGGINRYTDTLPIADAGKLVIGQKNGEAKITIGDGEINLRGVIKVNGSQI